MATTNLNTLQPDIYQMVKRNRNRVRDLSGKHRIELAWDLNPQMSKDRVFELSFDGQKAYVDLEELLRITRVM